MSEILNILVLILRKYFEVSDVPLTPRNRWVAQGLSCEKKDTLIFLILEITVISEPKTIMSST
jgi:hypothetical protein